jgi:transposase
MRARIGDRQWKQIEGQINRQGRMGRPRCDDRRTLEAIVHVLVTGCRWQELPSEYGHYSTAWRRLRQWEEDGTLRRIWRHLLGGLDARGRLGWSRCAIDGSYVKAKKGATKRDAPVAA